MQLDLPAYVEQLQRVFQAANAHGMAIVVHLRASISRNLPYGAVEARVFLEQLLPLVPDIPMQIAHLASAGPGYDDPPAQQVMAVLAEAIEQGDPRTNRLWFDVATVVDRNISPALANLVYQGKAYQYPKRFFLVHAMEHSIEHRTEVKVALACIGIETPDLDGWSYAQDAGYGNLVS